jgi:hypothetical protein
MRNLALLLCLASASAWADNHLSVASHSLLRLPATEARLQLERLEVAEQGTLLIPASVTELRIGELHLGPAARIGIAPGEQPLRLEVLQASVAEGVWISAQGAPGGVLKPATAGRELSLRLQQASIQSLTLDVRGGRGAPGYRGLDGANGQAGGCTWGRASHGHDGQNGGDGQAGAMGGQVRLEVPQELSLDGIRVLLAGGAGGAPGAAGEGGHGGDAKGCLLYSVKGAADGQPGQSGREGSPGRDGELDVVRF